MQMTEAFATTVAVTVPIFALAAGAEARGIRERAGQTYGENKPAEAAEREAPKAADQ